MKWILISMILGVAFSGSAQNKEQNVVPEKPKAKAKAEVFLHPTHAGPEFADQGEYTNSWGGAQVIALGEGNFRLVTYPGGLPGSGWDKKTRTEIDGKREGEIIVFRGTNDYHAKLGKGTLVIKTANGGPWTMTRAERISPTLGAKAPPGAIVLFDGTNADAWENGEMDERRLLSSGTRSKQSFTNFTAHLEFLLPFKPLGRGQDRGNSGVYLQDRYEVQILDSFGLSGEDNECGGFYKQARPAVNMCLPPLVWQTYDIDFTSARYDESGKKIKNARVTVKHNGVTIHDDFELKQNTAGNKKNEDPSGGPFYLQGHGNPVFYRNIWVLPK